MTEDLLKPEKTINHNHLRVLDLDLDLASGTVSRRGEVIDLPDLSYRLLKALVEGAPGMLSKDELISRVWGEIVVSDETLMQRVKLLRQAIGDDSRNPRYITSVRGRGYRLAAPVEPSPLPGREQAGWFLQYLKPLAVIAALAITAIGIAVALRSDATADQTISALAVLPFDDLSKDRRFGYFADGMHEELLAHLAGLDQVSVLSRTSVERFRDATESIPSIANSLDVDAIIESSVRVNADRLRITVQLIDGETDQHLWAETYDEELTVENVFSIQEKVATSIGSAIESEYRRQQSAARGLPTTNLDAYNLYLLGRHHTFRLAPQDLEMAAQYLEQAIERDPDFAEAHAILGWTYSFLGTPYGGHRPRDVYPRAKRAALRALELDNSLADAHALLADILTWYDWNFEIAELEYRRAMALEPTNVVGYALFLSSQGRHDEAIEMVNRRIEASPDDEFVWVNAGWRLLNAGRFEEALNAVSRSMSHPDAANLLGRIRIAQGEIDEAIAVFQEDLDRNGRSNMKVANLAYAYFKANEPEKGQELLSELEERSTERFVPSLTFAAIYFAAGEDAAGYEMLAAAVEARERGIIFLNVSNTFGEQRDDARFKAILQDAGLPRAGG